MSNHAQSTIKTSALSQIKLAFVVSIIAGIAAGRRDDNSFEFQKIVGTGVVAFVACLIIIAIGSLFHTKE